MKGLRSVLSSRGAWRLAGLACAAWLVATPQGAPAQPSSPPEQDRPADAAQRDIDAAVAASLFEQAKFLHARGRDADAVVLLRECLARSQAFEGAAEAARLLASLTGAPGQDSGTAADTPGDEVADPYGDVGVNIDDTGLLNPYSATGDAPLDPYGETGANDSPEGRDAPPRSAPDSAEPARPGRVRMLAHGAFTGFAGGLALGGPFETDDFGDTQLRPEAVVIGLVGLAAGVAAGHVVSKRYPLTEGQAAALQWGGIGGAVVIGALADVASGIDRSDPNDIVRGAALGALLGTGASALYVRRKSPSPGDVALTSSLSLYGAMGGLLVGAVMQPPQSEAYSINVLIGAALGMGTGAYAASRVDTSRRRMLTVDLGAALGATLPWMLLYPAIDDKEDAEIASGLFSTVGMIGGAYLAWRLTRSMDAKPERIGRLQIAQVPALIQRHSDGEWGVGSLALRPVRSVESGARGWAVDVLGGQF